jgi:hypothetical protein
MHVCPKIVFMRLFSRSCELLQVRELHIQIYTKETALVNHVMIEAMFWNAFQRACARTHAHARAHILADRQSEMLCRSCGGISRSVTHAATVTENKRFYRVLQEVTSCVKLPLSPAKSAKCLSQPAFYLNCRLQDG